MPDLEIAVFQCCSIAMKQLKDGHKCFCLNKGSMCCSERKEAGPVVVVHSVFTQSTEELNKTRMLLITLITEQSRKNKETRTTVSKYV